MGTSYLYIKVVSKYNGCMRTTPKGRDALVCEMILKGHSYRETAKAFKISHERVRQIYRKSYPQQVKDNLTAKR